MTSCLPPAVVRQAFLAACYGELQALKPGNVHIHAGGHKLTIADFEKSADAAAPFISQAGLPVGARILAAVRATRQAVQTNTNLGIVLLAAPIAQAALEEAGGELEARVSGILAGLSVNDADLTYEAIRLAEPGGLGEAQDHDVSARPEVTLLEAMRVAQARDKIAFQYCHEYRDVVAIGLPRFREGLLRWQTRAWATAYCYMGFLGSMCDSLIERKFGRAIAEDVRLEAARIDAGFEQACHIDDISRDLLAFDDALKERGLNPGTSADLTVATVFWHDVRRALESA